MAITKKTPSNKSNDSGSITIEPQATTTSSFCLLGTTPLIQNRLPEKARQELLLPHGRKTAAEKAARLKHVPLEEFKSSIHRMPDPFAATLLGMPASAFKRALASAALDVEGVRKSQIGRLTYVKNPMIEIYGIPQVLCSIVRQAGMDRTPDVRTRAIVPQWCATISVVHPSALISSQSLSNLLTSAGLFVGVGDWRTEKGAGNFGSFTIVSEKDPAVLKLMKEGGRLVQMEAMEHPVAYDPESEELLGWFDVELKRRGFKAGTPVAKQEAVEA